MGDLTAEFSRAPVVIHTIRSSIFHLLLGRLAFATMSSAFLAGCGSLALAASRRVAFGLSGLPALRAPLLCFLFGRAFNKVFDTSNQLG